MESLSGAVSCQRKTGGSILSLLHRINRGLASRLIKDFDDTQSQRARVEHGLVAGRISIAVTVTLFSIQMILSWLSGSISVLADAFHLVSHLTNAIILVLTFQIMSRPATAKRPFGYGRMEYVAPLAMSVFLFVSGFQLLETSLHQITDPHAVHFFPALPLILLIGIIAKEWAGSFVNFLGERVHSKAIHTTGFHHRIPIIPSISGICRYSPSINPAITVSDTMESILWWNPVVCIAFE